MNKTKKLWMLAAILILCGTTATLASCSKDNDSTVVTPAAKEYFTQWNQCEALTALQDYVQDVTNVNSPNYIQEEDRIATFDMDGTFVGELYPSYFEYNLLEYRALDDPDYEAPKDVMETAQEIRDFVRNGKPLPDHFDMKHAYAAAKAYAIPSNRVIGMDVRLVSSAQGTEEGVNYTMGREESILRTDELIIKNLKTNKVKQIAQEIGKVPVLSFGNSGGDAAMHNYALSNPKYKSAAFMLIADDDQRDHANREKALTLPQQWREAGYHVISMRDDFKTIYGEGVTKTDFSFPVDIKPLTEWQAGRTVSQEAVEAFGGIDNCFAADPIPDGVWQRMQGKTYKENPYIGRDDLRHIRALHWDYDNQMHVGEMIVRFRRYEGTRVRRYEDRLFADNWTCELFSHPRTPVPSYLRIIPARPLVACMARIYNPYYKDRNDGTRFIQPATAADYCDRTWNFPYKIDHNDLCFRLFTEAGFEWGGDWTSCKDFQHFELIEE